MNDVIGLIDTDVHAMTKEGWPQLRRYVSAGWAARLDLYKNRFSRVKSVDQPGMIAPDGSRPGSDPDFVRSQLLDGRGLERAILLPYEMLHLALIKQIDDSIQIARVYNEYFIETWLPVDSRYSLAVGVSPHDPFAAAQEIRRVGDVPGVVAVLVPVLNILLGHRRYYPIYEAAEAAGLPVIIHRGYDGPGTPQYAGGTPATPLQRECLFGGQAMANVTSLVFEGTFQRYPRLKVVFSDWGFSWLVHQLPRMDEVWRRRQHDPPGLNMPPSHYVRRHIRFGAQPIDESDLDFTTILRLAHAEGMILFGSDYPYSGTNLPNEALAALPEPLKRRILRDCARETFVRLEERQTKTSSNAHADVAFE